MESMTIRRAQETDLPALNRLLYQVHKVHSDLRPDLFREGAKKYTDEELRKVLADEHTPVFVAEQDGQILGHAFCVEKIPSSDSLMPCRTLFLDDLCVDEAARGKQVGRRLCAFVEDYARQRGFDRVTLHVWAGNDGALRLYESLGFSVEQYSMEKCL